MLLTTISLQNFRNYTKANFNFSSDTTVIIGPNTIGKTNILEAIFLLAIGKSFRAEKDVEMIKLEEEIGRVKCEVRNGKWGGRSEKLEILLTSGEVGGKPVPRKKYLVNGISKRQMDFVGNLRAVLFSPTDLELVTDSPSLRRKYLDFVLTQVDREYRRALLSYEKGLRQRNRLLERIRDEGLSLGQLHFWNELLIKNGQVLSHKRREFINFVNHKPQRFGNFQLDYDNSEISSERLLKYQKEEIASSQTLVGPHRDDWSISKPSSIVIPTEPTRRVEESYTPEIVEKDPSTSGRTVWYTPSLGTTKKEQLDISLFGSRGEQRLAILWLKMAELEFVADKSGERPILLLDDIFSELDKGHRKLILEIIPKQQTIITTTDLHHIEKEYLEKMQVIELK